MSNLYNTSLVDLDPEVEALVTKILNLVPTTPSDLSAKIIREADEIAREIEALESDPNSSYFELEIDRDYIRDLRLD